MKEASKLLENDPIKTGSTTTDFIGTRKWHLNYYAVRALMARVYMYKNDKENALACAKEVIDSEKFPWITNDKVTTTSRDTRDGLFKSECIFMLNNRSLKTLTEKYMKEGTSYGSGNILHVSPEVKDDIFEAATYGGYDWRDNYYFEQLDGNYYGSTKLWQGSNNEYNNQQPLIRASEMWLIAAECATSKTDAVNYLVKNIARNLLARVNGSSTASVRIWQNCPILQFLSARHTMYSHCLIRRKNMVTVKNKAI